MKKFNFLVILTLLLSNSVLKAQDALDYKENSETYRVWINSDLNINYDPDDKVTLAQMLLLSDKFDIRGMVFLDSSWVVNNAIPSYESEYNNLSSMFDYPLPSSLNIYQASTPFKKFDPSKPVAINKYHTVSKIIKEAEQGHLYLLNWGPMTEVAFLMKYLIDSNKKDIIDSITIISHWTQDPEKWNYRGDKKAVEFLQDKANSGLIKFYEIGRSGQDLVDKGSGKIDKTVITKSKIGKLMDLKWEGETPDMSDGGTYLVLMGFGGGIDKLSPDGKWDKKLTERLRADRAEIFKLVEQRAKLAFTGRLN